jgi:hypothetical protein
VPSASDLGESDIRYARRALLAGLALTAVAVGLTLSRSPPRVARTNGVVPAEGLATISKDATICQAGEALPRQTTTVRASIFALIGPRVTLEVLSGTQILTEGARGSGWTAGVLAIPVRPVSHTASNVKVCMTLGTGARGVAIGGQRTGRTTAATVQGKPSAGRMRIEYLQAGSSSWWSQVLSIARRMGLGHAAPGTWIAPLLIAAMIAAAAIASWLLVSPSSPAEIVRGWRRRPGRRRQAGRQNHTGGRQQAGGRSPTVGRRRTGAGHRTDGHTGVVRPGIAHKALRAVGTIPSTAWACALIAFVNAACWSFIMPPFQVPDEVDHYAYVQQLAETGRLPNSDAEGIYSSQEQRALQDLNYYEVREAPETHTISSEAEQRKLEQDLALPLSQQNNHGAAGVAASQPPLYYALEAIPYRLGGSNLLDRLELMRLLSAMMSGATVLFVFLFLREALPRAPRAWLIGSLGVAFAPLLGFISGGVNPDALLATVSAALLYCLARGFRRGLSPMLAVAIGCAIAVGFLTKLNFIGLAPGAILGVGLLAVREARTSRRLAARSLAIVLAIAASPILLYVVRNLATHRPVLGEVSNAARLLQGSVFHAIGYIWQFYLPRLPGMHNYFPAISTTRQIWFDRLVGLYGWLDTVFPGWVYSLALIPAGLIAILCVRTLAVNRAALRHRSAELLTYAVMLAGLLTLIGMDSYINSFKPLGELYAEPRYLLPMLALAGAVLALAAEGAGRRWAPAVGALIVTAVFAHDIFSQLLVISRYYG